MGDVRQETLARAERLAELHRGERPLVLPTVWDAWSARTAEAAGFLGLTIGSHPLADSLGYADGEQTPLEEVFRAVGRITAAVDIPVSVDLESGYGADPDALVGGLLDAGGVGINLEDTVHGEGDRLRTTEEHAALIAAVRAAADRRSAALVVNGRTDLFLPGFRKGEAPSAELVREGLTRLRALVDAGADAVYPVGLRDDEPITTVVEGLDRPVNIICRPEQPELDRMRRLGVGRITFGPTLQRAMGEQLTRLVEPWGPDHGHAPA